MSAAFTSIKTPADYSKESEKTSSQPCGICRRQFSRYTCPNCNLLYCSLQCFRNPSHADCSEAFYRKEVESDIRTEPSKTAEERKRMMDLLKRFEEDAANDELDAFNEDDSNDSDEDDLALKLESMDLEHASYDDVWSALTPAQRDKFLRALNDPNSELARQLLTSEELENEIVEPWWTNPSDEIENVNSAAPSRRYGEKPSMMSIPPPVLHTADSVAATGPSLLYNVFAALMAYAYVSRSLSISPLASVGANEHQEARHLFAITVPFLTDRKSKLVLPSLSGIITDLWSRFETGTMTPSFFALLMRDASQLLRPSIVTPLSTPHGTNTQLTLDDHACFQALLALSDMSSLFSKPPSSKPGPNPTSAKLAFYAARIVNTPTYILKALADEASVRASLMQREGELDSTAVESGSKSRRAEDTVKPRIEELP